jgi:hypothetical protein
MCTISNKIKLCSCKVSSSDKLKHYWVLHRRNKDKNEMVVGQLLLPGEDVALHYESNYQTLENRLQESDVFDLQLDFKTRDVLEIVINNHDYATRAVYSFRYTKKQWIRFEIDTFDLMGRFDEIGFGKINNPIGKVKKE